MATATVYNSFIHVHMNHHTSLLEINASKLVAVFYCILVLVCEARNKVDFSKYLIKIFQYSNIKTNTLQKLVRLSKPNQPA